MDTSSEKATAKGDLQSEKASDNVSTTVNSEPETIIKFEIIVPPKDRQRMMNTFFEGGGSPFFRLVVLR